MIRILLTALVLSMVTACNREAPALDPAKYPLTKITERVYVIHGPNDHPTPVNQGFMNNPGFVLTNKGVVVIDPGSSVQVGSMVLKAIASVSKDPVVAVFNTHVHGDHWLGNDAIQRAYPKAVIYAHPAMIRSVPDVGEMWLNLMLTTTDQATRGTKLVAPTLDVEHDETLALGGLHFRALHNGQAHTDGDLMIEVVEEKVLFAGDNVVVERIGRFDEGNVKGAIAACDLALTTRAVKIVPGHGLTGGRELITRHRAWLDKIHSTAAKLYAQGVNEIDAKEKILAELKDYRHWNNFDKEIGKAISLTWLQVEKEAF